MQWRIYFYTPLLFTLPIGKTQMKFKHSAPAILIITVIIAVASISFVSNQISESLVAAAEEGQFNMMGIITRSKLKNAEERAAARAEIIALSPDVKAAFAERDRAKLLALTQDIYRVQSDKYGINQAQFHLAPAISFLRINKAEVFGDDISSFRQMVVDVNRNLMIKKGVNVTRSGTAILAVVPMTDAQGKHTGSFEMGSDFSPILDDLKASYNFELGLFIDEKLLHDIMDFVGGDLFNEKNRVGKYLKVYSTHSTLLRQLVSEKDINISEDSHYLRTVTGIPYGVLLQPVYDYAGKQIGVIATANNFSATRAAAGESIIWQALLAISAIILLAGIIIVVIRGLLLQPLGIINDRLDAVISSNECPRPIVDQEYLCDELQQLLNNYEALRKIRRSSETKK
jgi:hypothetical protein